MHATPFEAVGAERWDALVHRSLDGWVFALSPWLRMIGRVSEWRLQDHSFAAERDGRLVGVMPLHYLGESRRLASTGWGWMGPVLAEGLSPGERERAVAFLHAETRALADRLGATTIEMATPAVTARSIATPWGVNPFTAYGFEDCSTLTQVIDLSADEDALWAGLSKNARYEIRQAQKAGYAAAQEPWTDLVDDYYRVHQEAYARSDLPPHPRTYFDGFAREIQPTGHVALTVGRDPSGRAVAFHNTVRFGEGAIYTTGCSETAHRADGIDYLLFWSAILAAKRAGSRWYEAGEVHVGATDPKMKGLSTFKSKFGGELHRYFRGRLRLAASTAIAPAPSRREVFRAWIAASKALVRAARRHAPAVAPAASAATEQFIKQSYGSGALYAPSRICAKVDPGSSAHVQILLDAKMGLVRDHYRDGIVLDLCCATGEHLLTIAPEIDRGIGLDFTERYLHEARGDARGGNVDFLCGDAKRLPIGDGSIALVYSFSSLYAIPDVGRVLAEIGRVLRPGGIAVLDMGNSRSLNAYCLRVGYSDWPPIFPVTLGDMRRFCLDSGLRLVAHRSFQLLPLWAGKPHWLWPLLHPGWKRLLERRLGGKMLDEWISSLPVLRKLAFRHLLVCERIGAAP